jgi:hypothetical protein
MSVHIDISELATAVGELEGHPQAKKLSIVVPIEPGKRSVVREYVAEGPPFDFAKAGIERHEVFLTDNEVILVFETRDSIKSLERIFSEPEFWDVTRAWEHVIRERPRVAEIMFDWHA